MIRRTLVVCMFIVFAAACVPLTPAADATPTQDLNSIATQTAAAITTATAFIPTATAVTETLSAPTETAVPTDTQPAQAGNQFLAYISSDGQLLVTDVTNGVQGGTTQYTMAGESDQVMDLAWSPSGEFVAFTSVAKVDPHLFYIYALGDSSPTDLGPGSALVWSPDSQSIAYVGGTFPDENIFITTVENPAPRQLTFEKNYTWGRPVFTPDGGSLVVAGTDRNNLGNSGNTKFSLETLALDGSGTRTPLPGAQPFDGVRLPYDMQFSPDGTKLAFSTSYHLSACAAPGTYYVSNADGSNLQTLVSPSLKTFIDPTQEHYQVGLSYDWTTASDGIVALGNVVDCNLNNPSPGAPIAGPQMSIVSLDGSERTVIPGFFYGLSMDRTGSEIAAAHHQNGFQDPSPVVEIYSAQTGQLLLSLGNGSNPQFQP
jgi:WD40 repeat protein